MLAMEVGIGLSTDDACIIAFEGPPAREFMGDGTKFIDHHTGRKGRLLACSCKSGEDIEAQPETGIRVRECIASVLWDLAHVVAIASPVPERIRSVLGEENSVAFDKARIRCGMNMEGQVAIVQWRVIAGPAPGWTHGMRADFDTSDNDQARANRDSMCRTILKYVEEVYRSYEPEAPSDAGFSGSSD